MAGNLRTIFGGFLRTLHQLWLEVMGAVFLVFAFIFGAYAVAEYRKYADSNATDKEIWLLVSASVLSLATFAFGIHSFWKARKLR